MTECYNYDVIYGDVDDMIFSDTEWHESER